MKKKRLLAILLVLGVSLGSLTLEPLSVYADTGSEATVKDDDITDPNQSDPETVSEQQNTKQGDEVQPEEQEDESALFEKAFEDGSWKWADHADDLGSDNTLTLQTGDTTNGTTYTFDSITSLLPTGIIIMSGSGDSEKDKNVSLKNNGNGLWQSAAYEAAKDADGNYPQDGTYTFTAETDSDPSHTVSIEVKLDRKSTANNDVPATDGSLTLQQQTIEAALYTDATYATKYEGDAKVTLDGLLPADAVVKAYPVDMSIDGMVVLSAFDITIFYDSENNKVYEPQDQPAADGKNYAVNVRISAPEVKKVAEEYPGSLDAFHADDKNDSKPDPLAAPTVENGDVKLVMNEFSVAVVTESLEDALDHGDWEWVTDNEGYTDSKVFTLTPDSLTTAESSSTGMLMMSASLQRPVQPSGGYTFDTIKAQLPTEIKLPDGTTYTVNTDWKSDEYKKNADGTWPQSGEFTFYTTVTVNGVEKKLTLQVLLKDESTAGGSDADLGKDGLPLDGLRISINNPHHDGDNLPLIIYMKNNNKEEDSARPWLEIYKKNSAGRYELFKNEPHYQYKLSGNYLGGEKIKFSGPDTDRNYQITSKNNIYSYEFDGSESYIETYGCAFDFATSFNYDVDKNCEDSVLVLRTGTWNGQEGENFKVTSKKADWEYKISGLISGYGGESSVEFYSLSSNQNYEDSLKELKKVPGSVEGSTYGFNPLPGNKGSEYRAQTLQVTYELNNDGNGSKITEFPTPDESLSAEQIKDSKLSKLCIRNQSDGSYTRDHEELLQSKPIVTVKLSAPADAINSNASDWNAKTDDWHSSIDSQMGFYAFLYNYNEETKTYTALESADYYDGYSIDNQEHFKKYEDYKYGKENYTGDTIGCRQNYEGPSATGWGVPRNGSKSFTTHLAPGQAVVIYSRSDRYSYKAEVSVSSDSGSVFQYKIEHVTTNQGIASIPDKDLGVVTTGQISSYKYVDDDTVVPGQEIVLTTSRASSADKKVKFNKLSYDGTSGMEMRNLKVNLFDYDIPDDWHVGHTPENSDNNRIINSNSQGDVEYRFVSESDDNEGDLKVNKINKTNRSSVYTGILQSRLPMVTETDSNREKAILDPVFNFTLPFDLFDGKEGSFKPVGSVANNKVYKHDGTDDPYNQNLRSKRVYPNENFQFIYDKETSCYSYNSHANHAQLDETDNTVYQYDHKLGLGGSPDCIPNDKEKGHEHCYSTGVKDTWGDKAGGFFPFDTWNSDCVNNSIPDSAKQVEGTGNYGTNFDGTRKYKYMPRWSNDGTTLLRKEEDLDYHFGMSMEHEFQIPWDDDVRIPIYKSDGVTKTNDREDLMFSISGDDDIWLYVDGTLVLDMGGIHEEADGWINFTTGQYSVNKSVHDLSSLGGIFDKYSAGGNSGYWAKGSKHSFQLFYLERGGTLSDLSLKFNLPDVEPDKPVTPETPVPTGTGSSPTEFTVSKIWKLDNGGKAADSVTVALLRDAVQYDAVVLSAKNGWTHTFEVEDTDGHQWSAMEYNVPAGFTASVSTEDSRKFTIVNDDIPGTGMINIAAAKQWADGNNADGIRPASVTLSLMADGQITGKTLVLSDANGWQGCFESLPAAKADDKGNVTAINYTLFEDAVPGYTVQIVGSAAQGFVVLNTHASRGKPKSANRSVVETGDDSKALLYLAVMIAAACGLAVYAVNKKRKKR